MNKYENDALLIEALNNTPMLCAEAFGADAAPDVISYEANLTARLELAREKESEFGRNSKEATCAYALLGEYIANYAIAYTERVVLDREHWANQEVGGQDLSALCTKQ